jgi:hypothetical protein
VSSSAACLLCCGPVDPDQRRCPAFALAGVAAHLVCCSGCSTIRQGTAGVPAQQAGAAA